MEQGPVERQLIDASRKRGMPLPDKIANAPALLLGLDAYYDAFLELSTDRDIGMGLGPIPWSSLDRYAQRLGLDGDGYDDFRDLIRAMDGAFLKFESKRMAEKKEAQDAAKPAG